MNLSSLFKITVRPKKRVGRGIGSGKGGHTSGRGQKGQKTRGKIPLLFEGTKMKKSFLKRLPILKGKGKFKPLRSKGEGVNLEKLQGLEDGTEVTVRLLRKLGILSKGAKSVKILGKGEISKKLVLRVPTSKTAKDKIEKSGGKVL